jgi:hypothetical protein
LGELGYDNETGMLTKLPSSQKFVVFSYKTRVVCRTYQKCIDYNF